MSTRSSQRSQRLLKRRKRWRKRLHPLPLRQCSLSSLPKLHPKKGPTRQCQMHLSLLLPPSLQLTMIGCGRGRTDFWTLSKTMISLSLPHQLQPSLLLRSATRRWLSNLSLSQHNLPLRLLLKRLMLILSRLKRRRSVRLDDSTSGISTSKSPKRISEANFPSMDPSMR